jgi:membrane-anchored glycerophosphoryl diester phosphodiesterase (GDPDase)
MFYDITEAWMIFLLLPNLYFYEKLFFQLPTISRNEKKVKSALVSGRELEKLPNNVGHT